MERRWKNYQRATKTQIRSLGWTIEIIEVRYRKNSLSRSICGIVGTSHFDLLPQEVARERLMGDIVEPRREFIQTNSLDAD
jgi:hypothetical protein